MEKFCRYCGTQFLCEVHVYPKHCKHCRQLTWKNPLPVAVLLQPVRRDFGASGDLVGILLGKRAIAPFVGEWALISGYIDPEDKSIEDAARREWDEETFIPLERYHPNILSSFSDGRFLLTFVENRHHIDESVIEKFIVNSECSEVRVAFKPEKLCFESHTDVLTSWFEYHWNV